jgi:hypothetical protein
MILSPVRGASSGIDGLTPSRVVELLEMGQKMCHCLKHVGDLLEEQHMGASDLC